MSSTQLKTKSQKQTRTNVDTIMFTAEEARAWEIAPMQRELRTNDKVRLLAQEVADDDGVIPGILTFGIMGSKRYLLDGQHRREAFLLSGCGVGYADVRNVFFDNLGDMGKEFVRLNSALVKMKPDDILRGMEQSSPALRKIRAACPWIGYDCIRRGERSPVVGMSLVLRAWVASSREVPSNSTMAAAAAAQQLQPDDADHLVGFLTAMMDAWGRDEEFQRLWGGLNLTLCMWLWRRVVITSWGPRAVRLSAAEAKRVFAGLSANEGYLDWLVGRQLAERNRAPAYTRLTEILGNRISADRGKKVAFPRPAWALGRKAR